jgi:putative ABC transport system permease protein
MSWDTLRNNKMRSTLTVLGVVIGIMSIVGMTSLIRGFDQSLRDSIKTIGSDTIFVAKFSAISMSSGASFQDMMKRPNMTPEDAAAIQRGAPSIEAVSVILGQGGAVETLSHGNLKTKPIPILGVEDNYPRMAQLPVEIGRFFTATEVERRKNVVVLGQSPYTAMFPGLDPIGKKIRLGLAEYEVIGVLAKRPSLGGLASNADDLAVIPQTTYQKQFGLRAVNFGRGEMRPIMIGALPREGVNIEQAKREVEGRHAHPPRPAARPGERLRRDHAGRGAWAVGSDQQRHVSGAGRALVDRPARGRHRRDEHHDDLRHRTDP